MFSLKSEMDDLGINLDELEVAIRDKLRTAIAGLAKAAQNEWIRLAQTRLKSSRADYINGLRAAESFVTDRDPGGEPLYVLALVGKLPNMVEYGISPYDMKQASPGWLGGGKARTAKDGHKYIIIPFRHSTGSSGAIAYTGKAAAADMQSRLKEAMGKGVTIPTGSSTSMSKMQRTESGDVIRGAAARIPSNADVHNYLQGMVRVQEPTAGRTSSGKQKGSSQLVTFRIMSANSPADSWQHPGLEARDLLSEVERFVNTQITRLVENVMAGTE